MSPIKTERVPGTRTTMEQGNEAVRFGAKVNEEWAYSDELNDLLDARRSQLEGYRNDPEYKEAFEFVENDKDYISYLRSERLKALDLEDLDEVKRIQQEIVRTQESLKDSQDVLKFIERDWAKRVDAGEFGEVLDPEQLFQEMKDNPRAYIDMFDKDFYKRAKNIEAQSGKNTRRGLAPQEAVGTVSLEDRAMYVDISFNPTGGGLSMKTSLDDPSVDLMTQITDLVEKGAGGARMSPENQFAPFIRTATFGGKEVPIDAILKTAGHESGHDLQYLGDWMMNNLIKEFDNEFAYYIARDDNPIARRFKDAMVEPKKVKMKIGEDDILEEMGEMEFDTWLASPMELHSDLMGVRTSFVNDIMQKEGVSMREAVKKLKANEGAYLDDMMKVTEDGKSVIGRHFKDTTSPEEIKSILKLLPAVLTGALIVGQQSEEQTNLAYGGKIRPIKKYDDGGELPLNRKRVESIKRRAEKAFEAGDMEAAKELAAKADKIGKRLDARSKRIDDFAAEQQRREAANAKARARTGSGMDQLFKELRAEQDRQLRASGNVVIPKSVSGSSPS